MIKNNKLLITIYNLFTKRMVWKITLANKFLYVAVIVSLFGGFTFAQSQEQNIHVRLGYSVYAFQDVSPADASAAVKVYAEAFKERLEKRLHKQALFTSKIYNSINEIIDALRKNELDLISILSTEYFQLKKQHDIYPFLAVTAKEDAYEQFCLIVRNDLKIKQIQDLTGKKLAMPDPNYQPVMMEWLFNYLVKNKMPEPSNIFKHIKTFDKESNAVYDIFFKNSDCAVVRKSVFSTLCELNPQIKNTISIFTTSIPMVLAFLAANTRSDKNLMKITVEEIQDFHLTPGGKNILNIFKANKWIKIGNAELKNVEDMLNENAVFRKKLSVKKK